MRSSGSSLCQKIPFLQKDRFKYGDTFALPSGRLPVSAPDLDEHQNYSQLDKYRVHPADGVDGTSYTEIFTELYGDRMNRDYALHKNNSDTVVLFSRGGMTRPGS